MDTDKGGPQNKRYHYVSEKVKRASETSGRSVSICMVALDYFPGIGSTGLYAYAKGLAEAGHAVVVVCAGRPSDKETEQVGKVSVYRVPTRGIQRQSVWPLFFTYYARSFLRALQKKQKLDIVHVRAYPGCSLLKCLTGDLDASWICDVRSGPISDALGWFLGMVLTGLETNPFDYTLALDPEAVPGWFGTKSIQMPLGVDTNHFAPSPRHAARARAGFDQGDIVAVYAGSIARKRNLDVLLYALAEARRTVPRLRLLLVGTGNDIGRLRALSHRLGLLDWVNFTGYIDYLGIPQLLNSADIGLAYVPITPAYERQPVTKLLECLSCGLATIATRTAAISKVATDGKNALVTADDWKSIAKGMVLLATDVRMRETLAVGARNSVEAFDWQRIIEEVAVPFYLKVAESRYGRR